MQGLWLSDEHMRAITQHVMQTLPNEACGMIGGVGDQARIILPVPNIAADPQHHFTLDSQAFIMGMKTFNDAGLSLIGFYHSHPTGDPIPSQTDIQLAAYPDTAYLIVGVRHAEPRFKAWLINYGDVTPLPLIIGDRRPDFAPEPPLSSAQKTAILLSAVMAFVVMILLSIALLPPAPEIPIP